MSTSLAEQLRRLQTPQSSQFVDTRKRDSILFTSKEAATKSRETIYEIGLSGLQELIEINSAFSEFESTLFDYTSREVQRAVETKDVNVLLNKNIKRFMFQLSPYFLLPSTHKCLEWLIRRFNINLYNKEEFLMLILPYHQTNIFVRCVQTMKFDDATDKWVFLSEVKKSSTPLSKYAIWNNGASNPKLLEFVGKFTYEAVKELGQRAGSLQTMISFYLTTIIGAVEQTPVVNENHIVSIIKYIGKTNKSNIVDYAAAGYMITAHLLSKTKLIVKLLNTLMDQMVSNVQPILAQNILMVLIVMFQTQSNELEISDTTLEKLIESRWCIKVLEQIESEGRDVTDFLKALVRAVLKKIQEKDEKSNECKEFCENLFNQLSFNEDDADVVIRTVLESYIQEPQQQQRNLSNLGVISLDSDDDESIPFKSQDITLWYSDILKMLERRYPNAFDKVVKDVMTSNPRRKRNSLKNVLGFLLKVSCFGDENSTSIFENLYHHNPHIRSEAVSYIAQNFEKLSLVEQNHEILKLSLSERINDDNPSVVAEVLKLNFSSLYEVLGEDEMIMKLVKILSKYWIKPDKWRSVCESALKMLTSNIGGEKSLSVIFIALLPFFSPSNEFFKIMKNSQVEKILKLQASNKDFQKSSPIKSEDIFATIQSTFGLENIELSLSSHFAIYAYAISLNSQQEAQQSLQAFRVIRKILQNAPLNVKNLTDTSTIKNQEVSLQVVLLLIEKLLKFTNFSSNRFEINFKSETDETKLKMEILDFLVTEFFTNAECRVYINAILKVYFNFICGENKVKKVEFLSQFCVIHTVGYDYVELQAKVMQLLSKVLENFDDESEHLSCNFFQNIIIAFASKSTPTRNLALKIADSLVKLNILSHWKSFLEMIISRQNEISLDFEQISLIIFLIISSKKKVAYGKKILSDILAGIQNQTVENYVQSELLLLLKHLTDKSVLDVMAQIATTHIENTTYSFDNNQSAAIKLILMKINGTTIVNHWSLVMKALNCHQLMNDQEGKILTPSILTLQAIENEYFVKLHPDHKMELINAIIRSSMVENPKIIQAARVAFQNVDLDCKIFKGLLIKMFKIQQGRGGRTVEADFAADDWKFGLVLLELLQIKANGMKNEHELIVTLFEILDLCLLINCESEVEYAMQIILTLLLSICKKISPSGKEHRQFNISDSTLKTELIINCIKKSPNPQTHHHALLFLAHLALMTPDQVLNDIIPIFTFVGNAIVRHDDSYSYQIIDRIIENIVPKLIKDNAKDDLKAVIPVLKIFTSIVLDVPEHRRLQLYKKLIMTLGAEKFLWPFIAVLLEGQVMLKKKQHQQQKQPHEDLPPRIYFALLLAKEFDLKTIILTINSMILYLKSLPMVIATTQENVSTTTVDNSIFCVKTHTNFQLRGYKYITTVFLKYLLESSEVINKAESLKNSNEVDFNPLISNCLLFIPIVSKHHEASNQNEKMMTLFLQHLFEVLEATIALLSPNMLLVFVEKLIEHESMHVRRKALEIFNWKLEKKFFDNCKQEDLLKLLTPLRSIYGDINKRNCTPIEEDVHQSALNSVRILSKKFSEESSEEFVEVLRELTDLLPSENIKKDVLASLANCIGELVFDLKVLAIEMLHKILTSFVNFLTVQDDHRSTFNLLLAVTSSLLKIIETVPLFLSPYLKQIIQQISRVSPALKQLQDHKIKDTLEKISKIWTSLAKLVPLRVLLPTLSEVHDKISDKKNFSSIEPLMEFAQEIFQQASGSDLKAFHLELTDFFIRALDFRCIVETHLNESEINALELLIIKALVALILKQSEGSFRPLYEKIYEWGIKDNDGNYLRAITFFRLTNEIAKALKSLFLLFASEVIDSAAEFLNKSNPAKSNELCFEDDNRLNLYLTEYILRSLYNIFLHDHKSFVNSKRFDIILQPIVDEIDNEFVIKDEGIQELLRMCIAQLAIAAADDIMWKPLNYQVLLKTRSDVPEVRILGLKVSVDIVKKLGNDFEPLIPEMIPFLSELLEDDNHNVVTACQNGVRELEATIGESLQKYF